MLRKETFLDILPRYINNLPVNLIQYFGLRKETENKKKRIHEAAPR